MTKINVEGERYPVTENLGFQGGHYAKAVGTPDGERIAVKRGGVWTWWTAYDKVAPRGHYVGMQNTCIVD